MDGEPPDLLNNWDIDLGAQLVVLEVPLARLRCLHLLPARLRKCLKEADEAIFGRSLQPERDRHVAFLEAFGNEGELEAFLAREDAMHRADPGASEAAARTMVGGSTGKP